MLSFDNRSSTDSNELNGRGCMEMESDSADLNMIATPAVDAWERMEEVATGGHLCDVSLVTTGVKPGFRHQQNIKITINNYIVYFAGLLAA